MAKGALAQAACCHQPWSHPHSFQIQTCKAVNKSALRGRCYLCPSGWAVVLLGTRRGKGVPGAGEQAVLYSRVGSSSLSLQFPQQS